MRQRLSTTASTIDPDVIVVVGRVATEHMKVGGQSSEGSQARVRESAMSVCPIPLDVVATHLVLSVEGQTIYTYMERMSESRRRQW